MSVSHTVSEISGVEEWRDLENGGRGFLVIENGAVR